MRTVNFVTTDLLDSEGRLLREWAKKLFVNDVLVNGKSVDSEGKAYIDLTPYAFQKDLDSESNRAKAEEALLQSEIDSEANRAKIEEALLQSEIDSESNRAIAKEALLQFEIDSEANRAKLEEALLQSEIDSESSRAIAVEDGLQLQIDSQGVRLVNLENNKLDNVIEADKFESRINYTEDGIIVVNNGVITPVIIDFDSEGNIPFIEVSSSKVIANFEDISSVVATKDKVFRLIDSESDEFILRSVLDDDLAKKQDNLVMGNNMEWDSEGKLASTVTFDYDPTTGILNIYNH